MRAHSEVREPSEGTDCVAPGRSGKAGRAPLRPSEQPRAEVTRAPGTTWTTRGPERGCALSAKDARGARCARLQGAQLPGCGRNRAADGAQLRAHWSKLETLRARYFKSRGECGFPLCPPRPTSRPGPSLRRSAPRHPDAGRAPARTPSLTRGTGEAGGGRASPQFPLAPAASPFRPPLSLNRSLSSPTCLHFPFSLLFCAVPSSFRFICSCSLRPFPSPVTRFVRSPLAFLFFLCFVRSSFIPFRSARLADCLDLPFSLPLLPRFVRFLLPSFLVVAHTLQFSFRAFRC